jgi:hypothetical protein
MAADARLIELSADARRRAPNPPALDQVIEDAGRQRLAAYYVYGALIAGVIDGDGLAPGRWPPELAEPMQRMGLTRLAPRAGRGLDAQLTPAEQAMRRRPDRQLEFAQLLVEMINDGAFGPLCGDADEVRLAGPDDARDLQLIKDRRVIGTCKVKDHWELVAQHLAGAPLGGSAAEPSGGLGQERRVARRVGDSGIAHAVSLGTTLAVSIHPLGTVAGLGTRLVESRIHAGQDEADAFRRLGQDLRALQAQSADELAHLEQALVTKATSRRGASISHALGQPRVAPFCR